MDSPVITTTTSRVPTLVSLCERKPGLVQWFRRISAVDFTFAAEEYKRLYPTKYNSRFFVYITDFTNSTIQTIFNIKLIFFKVLVKDIPTDLVLKPTSSLKMEPFLNDQIIIRDLAKHICIFLNNSGKNEDIMGHLQSLKAFSHFNFELDQNL